MGIHANQQSSVNLGRMTAIIGNQDDGIHANASSLNQWGDDGDYLLVKDNWGRGIGLWRGGEGEFNNVHVENNGHGGDASNPDLNLWNEVRFLLNERQDIEAFQVLKMATLLPAEALASAFPQLAPCGAIAAGFRDSLALVSTTAVTQEQLYRDLSSNDYRNLQLN